MITVDLKVITMEKNTDSIMYQQQCTSLVLGTAKASPHFEVGKCKCLCSKVCMVSRAIAWQEYMISMSNHC